MNRSQAAASAELYSAFEALDSLDESTPAVAAPVEIESRPPERLVSDRYLLRASLGQGRFGEMHDALDQQITEVVREEYPVKLEISASRSDGPQLRGLSASAFVDSLALSHPNLSKPVDFGTDCSSVFLVTEFEEGLSLREAISGTGDVENEEVLAVVNGLAATLHHAHGKGIVHGALTLDSVWITSDLEVKLMDLSAALLERSLCSNELRFGGEAMLTAREDVFGLACIAYEMLSGVHPFGGFSQYEALRQGMSPPRIKGVPRYQAKALSRALRLQEEDRTPTVAEFATQFGVTGGEKLSDVGREGRRAITGRGVSTLLFVCATLAGVVYVQQNFTDLSFTGLTDRFLEWSGNLDVPGFDRTVDP